MVYKIRVILNTEEDVIRDIAILKSDSLEDLHNAITNAFGFTGNEMASFYRADEDWNQGEEFPLFDMGEGMSDTQQMQDISLEDVLTKNNDKLIYIYDFLTMWSFYVELIEVDIDFKNFDLPSLLLSLGSVPKSLPDIKFESEDLSDDVLDKDDDIDIDFDEFDEFDEFV